MSLTGAAGPTACRLQRGMHPADVRRGAIPLGPIGRGRSVGALRIRFVVDGYSSARTFRPGLAATPSSTVREGRVHPSRPRTVRAWSGTESCWPGRDDPRARAPARRRQGRAVPISRSVAMLSLAEIICCAAVRTDTCDPGGSVVEAGRADGLVFLGDGQRIIPADRARFDRIRNAEQHIELEDRRERQRVGRRCCLPPPSSCRWRPWRPGTSSARPNS